MSRDSNTLDLDIGNSCTKWRIANTFGVVERSCLPTTKVSIERVRVATVSQSHEAIKQLIVSALGVEPEFASSTRTLCGVVSGYPDVATLGVDRWLAVVAAWNQSKSNLVVFDIGTAMTADFVREDGAHLGGFIVPSVESMRKTLGILTENVQVKPKLGQHHILSPGTNTIAAVHHGLIATQMGFIDRCIELGASLFGSVPHLVMTGGNLNLELMREHFHFVHRPHLVLEGLDLALP